MKRKDREHVYVVASCGWWLALLSVVDIRFVLLYSPLAKCPADEVKGNGINAAVDEAQTEANDPESVPEVVEVLLGRRREMEPQHEHVVRQEANEEDNYEGDHHLSDLSITANEREAC